MSPLDRFLPPYARGVASVVTAIIAAWFALTFAVTVGAVLVGA